MTSTVKLYFSSMVVMSRTKKIQGQFLILMAVTIPLLIGFMGLAIDVGISYGVKAKLNAAVDAASISGARALANGADDAARVAAVRVAATNFYQANFPSGYLGATPGAVQVDAVHDVSGYWRITVSGSALVKGIFQSILGFGPVQTVSATGQAIRRDLDIVLVLDTSGSLGPPTSSSTTFPTLKNAAINSFVSRFNAGTNGDRVGLVSFASGGVVDVAIKQDGTRGFNETQVTNAINALTVGGSTASAEGMRLALNQMNGVPAISQSSLRMIVFFSDGAPNDVSAVFSNGGSSVTGDLYSETSGSGTSRATNVYRYDRRDSLLGTYNNITNLPANGFSITGVGNIPLASFNGKRTLSGNPVTNTLCNVNKAARNMLENVANTARSQGIKIYSIGLGSNINQLEISMCAYGSSEYGSNIMNRIANTKLADTYNSVQPTGMYVWAADESQLSDAFSSIASEILRLSK